jgi:hypothetical protein
MSAALDVERAGQLLGAALSAPGPLWSGSRLMNVRDAQSGFASTREMQWWINRNSAPPGVVRCTAAAALAVRSTLMLERGCNVCVIA